MKSKDVSLQIVSALALSIDIGFARLGYGLTLPAMKQSLDGSFSFYGMIATLHLGGYLIGSLLAPSVLRRYDWKAAFLGSHILVCLGLLFQANVDTVGMLAVSRVFLGVATGFAVIFTLGSVMEAVEPKRRLMTSCFVWTGVAVGMMLTSPLAGWTLADPERWRTVWWTSSAPTAFVVLLGFFCTFPSYKEHNANSELSTVLSSARELRRSTFLLISYFLYGFSYFVYATFALSDLLKRLSLSGITPGFLWFIFALAAGVGSLFLPIFVGGKFKKHAMALSVAVAAIGAGIAVVPSNTTVVLGALLIGFGLTSTPAIASALTRSRVTAAAGPNALAVATIAVAAGQMFGPAITGYSIDTFGISSMIWLVFGGYIFATIFAIIDTNLQKQIDA